MPASPCPLVLDPVLPLRRRLWRNGVGLLECSSRFGITKATSVLFKRQKSTMNPSSTAGVPASAVAKPATGRATLIGISAILMWALLAPLTALTGALPPFQTVAVAFAIGGLTGLCGPLAGGRHPVRSMRQPAAVWLLNVGGLFGFHFLYFLSLKSAPAVEAKLINYMWPLFIVLFSALLPGERLRWWHIAGAVAGLAG